MNTSSCGGRKYHRQKELCDLAMCTGCEDVGKKGSGELDQWGTDSCGPEKGRCWLILVLRNLRVKGGGEIKAH